MLSGGGEQDHRLGELNDGYIEVDFDAKKHDEYDQTPHERDDSSEKPGTELANSNVAELRENIQANQLTSEYLCTQTVASNPPYVNVGVVV